MADTFQVLGDRTRLKIVLTLANGRLSVGDIAKVVGITESGVSHQLRLLRDRRIVRAERVGQRTYYSLDDAHLTTLFREADFHADHVQRHLPAHPSDRAAETVVPLDPGSSQDEQAPGHEQAAEIANG